MPIPERIIPVDTKSSNTIVAPIEPKTFAEKHKFLREANRDYLKGRISHESLWYYEQRYGIGRR